MPLDLPLYRIHKLNDFFPRWPSVESSHLLPPDRPCTQKGNQKGIPKQLNFYSVCSHSMSNLIKYKNFLEMVDQWAVESKKSAKICDNIKQGLREQANGAVERPSLHARLPEKARKRALETERACPWSHTKRSAEHGRAMYEGMHQNMYKGIN